jgi:hypothetical protein
MIDGHLDSWDLGDGSARRWNRSCTSESMGSLQILKNWIINLKNTLRVVLFMNEENGVNGGKKYAVRH